MRMLRNILAIGFVALCIAGCGGGSGGGGGTTKPPAQQAASPTFGPAGGTYTAAVSFSKALQSIQIANNPRDNPSPATVNENGAATFTVDTAFVLNGENLTFVVRIGP